MYINCTILLFFVFLNFNSYGAEAPDSMQWVIEFAVQTQSIMKVSLPTYRQVKKEKKIIRVSRPIYRQVKKNERYSAYKSTVYFLNEDGIIASRSLDNQQASNKHDLFFIPSKFSETKHCDYFLYLQDQQIDPLPKSDYLLGLFKGWQSSVQDNDENDEWQSSVQDNDENDEWQSSVQNNKGCIILGAVAVSVIIGVGIGAFIYKNYKAAKSKQSGKKIIEGKNTVHPKKNSNANDLPKEVA